MGPLFGPKHNTKYENDNTDLSGSEFKAKLNSSIESSVLFNLPKNFSEKLMNIIMGSGQRDCDLIKVCTYSTRTHLIAFG